LKTTTSGAAEGEEAWGLAGAGPSEAVAENVGLAGTRPSGEEAVLGVGSDMGLLVLAVREEQVAADAP